MTTAAFVRRAWIERRAARAIAALRPIVLGALENDAELPDFEDTPKARRTFIALARSLLTTLRGAERDRLAELMERAGVVNAALVDLHARTALRRARAADLLGRAQVRRAATPLIAALDDRNPDVRRCAARALGFIGSGEAVAPLLATIEPASVPLNTTTMAILRIGREARGPLIDGLESANELVRATSAELLGQSSAISALPELTLALERDPSLEVRIRAARALGLIGAPSSVDALADALSSRQPVPLRAVATRALGRIGGPRTISLLREALDAPEHIVAANAASALAVAGDDGEAVLVAAGKEAATRKGEYAREGLAQIELQRFARSRS